MNMMQRIFPSMVMLAVLSSLLSAQSDSAPVKPAAKTETVKKMDDLDASGLNDKKEQKREMKRTTSGMRDMFIDENGDGICDSREQGLGFRRGNGTGALHSGKRQQGRKK
jgi:hypothetical protein